MSAVSSEKEGFIIGLGGPVVMKATVGESGERLVDVEASCEKVDSEGDLILQKALLDSSKEFLENGHLDIDHYSEIGHRLGIPRPERFIIGRPIAVRDGGDKRTFVKGRILGTGDPMNPGKSVADEFWESLHANPPSIWYASVYGFNRDMEDFSKGGGEELGVRRWLVKGFYWKSLAFTKNPVNDLLKGSATIVSAKSWAARMQARGVQPISAAGMDSVAKARECDECKLVLDRGPTLKAWTKHFVECVGMDKNQAEVYAHAAMYKGLLERIS